MPVRKQIGKKQRRISQINEIENKYFIFCEGEQTEPLYFRGFEKAIKSNVMYKNSVHIEVEGVGKETLRVIYRAEEYVKENQLVNAQIWCVYDKDSFPKQDFNAVSQYADNLNSLDDYRKKGITFHAAWSNQCIEYWFILHFAWYDADNDRKYYRSFLHTKFQSLGWTRYEKNNAELFNILTTKGDPAQAIKRAKKRIENCCGCTDATSAPATKVYLLVEELAKYLPPEIRKRYLPE